MDRCPERETLEKFIDFELTEEMNENIFKHLQLCNDCKHTIRCLLSDEKDLLQSLVKAPIHSKSKTMSSSKRCLSKEAILAYATESMNANQLKLVESHLEKCDNCLNELINLQRTMALPAEVELDMPVLKTAEEETIRAGIDILEIVFKIKKSLLELINHTGELLHIAPQYTTVRGKEIRAEKLVVIRKDFEDRDLSIEITANKELDESGNSIRVSIMKLCTEEFMSGTGISISGSGVYREEKTDEKGIAEFYGLKKGKYDIKVSGESLIIITIQ